jgi:hypothetical protein
VTQILNALQQGDPKSAEQLLPFVYDELRKLAAQRMGDESSGQTLQPTALVHEAYLRGLSSSNGGTGYCVFQPMPRGWQACTSSWRSMFEPEQDAWRRDDIC